MSEQEHMNRGFLKEKLGNYQVDPPDKVWDAISGQIGPGRKRRGMYVLLLATAASIALAVGLGIHFFGPDLPGEQLVMDELDMGTQGLEKAVPEEPSELPPDESPFETREGKLNLALQEGLRMPDREPGPPESEPVQIRQPDAIIDPGATSDTEGITDQQARDRPEGISVSGTDPNRQPDLLPDSIREMPLESIPEMEPVRKKISRWMVGAAVSPLYSYRDADAGALPPDQAESGMLSYSTGIHVRYRRNSRFAIETGIYYNRTGIAIGAPGIKVFSQRYDNMIFGVGSESADIKDISNSVGNIVAFSGDIYMNGYKLNAENGSDALQSQVLDEVQVTASGIQQHLDYLELPFNLRYSVIDRTFELQVVGGLSTNFLVGNSVTMEGASGKEEIGYLTNLNTVNYSGNAGLGMIYHMGSKMSLFLEPRFRYFLNSVNDATLPATRPYSIGFYTGLNFTF